MLCGKCVNKMHETDLELRKKVNSFVVDGEIFECESCHDYLLYIDNRWYRSKDFADIKEQQLKGFSAYDKVFDRTGLILY